MTYTTETFNLKDALSGVLVGFTANVDEAGLLEQRDIDKLYSFQVMIKGVLVIVDREGKVIRTNPEDEYQAGAQLYMVVAEMGNEEAAGHAGTRGGPGGGTVSLQETELRDNFAINALNAFIMKQDHPEAFSDAKCLYFARAAYRWAQAMMIIAQETRDVEEEIELNADGTVVIETQTLETAVNKNLYNIGVILKNQQSENHDSLMVTTTSQGSDSSEPE